MQPLSTILGQIDVGTLTLPKFQRGYVWNRAQVRELMRSLYRGFPAGSFLVWNTPDGTFLLDGQQRITSLYGIIRGKSPKFSDADSAQFLNLYFNVETEDFEFYGKTKMQHNPRWVSVTSVMQQGIENALQPFEGDPHLMTYLSRLTRIDMISKRTFYVEPIDGQGRDLEEIVEMFNQVNSGGTKLTQGDLAMAKISVYWPQAREEMNKHLSEWAKSGYQFSLDWLLRCINALLTGHSQFDELSKHDFAAADIQNGLKKVRGYVDQALTLISSRLGLVDSSVMRSVNSIPAIIYYFDRFSGLPDSRNQDRLLYWYVCTLIWGRYSTSVESRMRQDLQAIDRGRHGNFDEVDALIERLQQTRGQLKVAPQEFDVAEARSRIFPLLYLLSRVYGVRDICSGLELNKGDLGKIGMLQRHHIFPNAYLRKHGISNRYERNALANFTWLTMPSNSIIGATPPSEYLPHYEDKHPGVLASNWIPMDPELWRIEHYRDFLAARRELLANAANDFLDQLYHGEIPESEAPALTHKTAAAGRPISIASDEEEAALQHVMNWMKDKGLPSGELGYELVSLEGELLATFDLAWPQGIQENLSQPAALLIDEDDKTLNIANAHGYRYFISCEQLQDYVSRDILDENSAV